MKVKVYNDGKGKSQSFEVWTDVFDVRGYGATEEEARNDYTSKLREHIAALNLTLKAVEEGHPTTSEPPITASNIIISHTSPEVQDRNKVWLAINKYGAPLGVYVFENNKWEQVTMKRI